MLTAADGLWGGGHPDVVLGVRGMGEWKECVGPQRSCLRNEVQPLGS